MNMQAVKNRWFSLAIAVTSVLAASCSSSDSDGSAAEGREVKQRPGMDSGHPEVDLAARVDGDNLVVTTEMADLEAERLMLSAIYIYLDVADGDSWQPVWMLSEGEALRIGEGAVVDMAREVPSTFEMVLPQDVDDGWHRVRMPVSSPEREEDRGQDSVAVTAVRIDRGS